MELFTIRQTAIELKLSQDRVRVLCRRGEFGVKFGSQWMITRQELDSFKKRRRPTGRPRKPPPP